jgi:glycosyltransferase involved in cell wall biosynthesis
MRLGIALSTQDTWHFFQDIYEDLKIHYDTDVFQFNGIKYPLFNERINNSRFHRNFGKFLKDHDVVFFEWASGLLEVATQQYPKVCKIVTRLHRFEMFEWVDKVNWEQVDKIILVSHAMLHKFSTKFPEQSYKTIVIPVGIVTGRFKYNPKKFNGDIGILCHLTPRKRVYELILAFYELQQIRKDLHLHIAGGHEHFYNDYFDTLQSIVYRLNLQESVTFYGKMSNPKDWYQIIDIFISNSYSEGLQVSPMEAMASGCYCLSHHWEGAEELLPEDNLFFTNNQMIEKILRYCELPELSKLDARMRLNNIVQERFDLEKIKISIRNVIDDLSENP